MHCDRLVVLEDEGRRFLQSQWSRWTLGESFVREEQVEDRVNRKFGVDLNSDPDPEENFVGLEAKQKQGHEHQFTIFLSILNLINHQLLYQLPQALKKTEIRRQMKDQ